MGGKVGPRCGGGDETHVVAEGAYDMGKELDGQASGGRGQQKR